MAGRLVDEVTVFLSAGDGGNGAASFHKTKHRPKGAADGGDGGSGGHVILRANPARSTLLEYKRKPHHNAGPGGLGSKNNRHGANADNLVLDVPVGTLVWDKQTGDLVADLAVEGAEHIVARGGAGGRGNSSLASQAERAPNFAEKGAPGEQVELRLEMRLVADVGLVGSPNAGKSTFLKAVSAADPKVADYPFTTLEPNLGVVDLPDDRFVIADLPGLIEGAAAGKGLGITFLRHAHRCAVIAGLVDLAGGGVTADLDMLDTELRSHDPALAEKLTVVVGTKTDLEPSDQAITEARQWATKRGADFFTVSSHDGNGVDELLSYLGGKVEEVREESDAQTFALFRPVSHDPIEISREPDASWRVHSERVELLAGQTPMGNPRAVRHMQRRFGAWGVNKALEEAGVQPGDTVRIAQMSFEWQP